jgi:hypothetical protein
MLCNAKMKKEYDGRIAKLNLNSMQFRFIWGQIKIDLISYYFAYPYAWKANFGV